MADHMYEQYTDNLLSSVFSNIPVTAERRAVDDTLLKKLQLQQESLERRLSQLMVDSNNRHSKVQRVPVKVRKQRLEEEDDDDDEEEEEEETTAAAKTHKKGNSAEAPVDLAAMERLQTEQDELHQLQKRKSLFSRKRKPSKTSTSTPQNISTSPSFWKPREERPKGWWKGNTEKPPASQPNATAAGHLKKKGSSLKKKSVMKPKRPMAFKPPTSVKKQSKTKKSKKQQQGYQVTTPEPTYTNYALPTSAANPFYYQPAPMMPIQSPTYGMPMALSSNPYMPPNMWSGPHQTASRVTHHYEADEGKRTITVYNPRQASNDRCSIM